MPQDVLDRPPRAEEEPTDGAAPAFSFRHMAWSLLLSVGVFGVVAALTFDPEAFGAFLHDLSPWLLVAALGTVVARVGFGAWRLRHFSDGQIGWCDGVRDQIVWDFFAYVTPSTVGGGPFLAVFLARDRQLPLGQATSVVLLAMLVDQIWFALTIPALLACALALDVFPQALGTGGAAVLMLFFVGYLVWVALLAYGTLVRPQHLARLVGGLFGFRWLRRFRPRAVAAMEDMVGRSRLLRAQPLTFYAKGFAISVVPWISRYLLAVFVIWSVFPGLDRTLAFLRAAALQLGTLAVPTPGGAGGAEGLYVLFLGPPLMPEPLVAPTLLVWRFLSFYAFIAAGVVLIARHAHRRSVPEARRAVHRAENAGNL